MKKVLICLTLLLSLFAKEVPARKVKAYFKEIAIGAEFGGGSKKIVKWLKPMKIYVSGKAPKYLDDELNKIISELNTLAKPMKLERVNSKKKSNYIICFGSAKDYIKIQPAARRYTAKNWGIFFIFWNKKNKIYKGSMYVDLVRCKNPAAQKHLLREELTQSLGLMKDSNRYKDSIFHGRWKPHTTKYSKIDKALIRLLYDKKVKPGMSFREAIQFLK